MRIQAPGIIYLNWETISPSAIPSTKIGGEIHQPTMLTHYRTRASLQQVCLALLLAFTTSAFAQTAGTFTCGKARHGETRLTEATRYTSGTAGWDLQASPAIEAAACASDAPFFFSIAEPDGNYQVTLTLGGRDATDVTVKAESRRLMLFHQAVSANASRTYTFNVNVRSAPIAGNAKPVKLKPREIGALDWDEKLTLEFNGKHPSVRSITIKPVDLPTLYIAGDSTVVDQDKEPWAAWGQMLPVFLNKQVVVSNQAESGETIRSFVGELRLAKVMSTMKSGDYLMIQFGHNDQKPGAGYVPAATMFQDLLHSYIDQARAHGATVILVTPMNRRNFDDTNHIKQTLEGYPQALRDVAAQEKLGLIDLNAMSKTFYETLGPEGTLHAFVHYPANTFPDQKDELKDDTHFNAYGAYELARCVVLAIQQQHLVLEKYLVPNIALFDPAVPDPFTSFSMPPSPFLSVATPYGR
jgi:lysophospholipase L1-like esterase